MDNNGKITVFLSFMLMVLMELVLAVLQIVSLRCAKTKAVTAVSSAVSGIQADYNPFIYERYHILLIDKNYGGAGEGKMEVLIEDSLSYTLGEKYQINSVELSGTTGILDGGCSTFKKQMADYIGYGTIEYTADKLIQSTGGFDEPVKEDALSEMDRNIEKGQADKNPAGDSGNAEQSNKSGSEDEDPRMRLRFMSKLGIAFLIQPEALRLSNNVVIPEEVPSYTHQGIAGVMSVAADFQDYDRLKKDVVSYNGWSDNLASSTVAIAYAADVFNCATDIKYDDTYLNCELEYLISGCSSDTENYKNAVDRIIQLRLGVNYAYLLTDAEKMAKVSSLAWNVSLVTFVPQPIVKYLLAGCWAYTEGVAEVYFLLRGEEIPYAKNAGNWITDINSLSDINQLEKPETDEAGMDYKEYLLLLLTFHMDTSYYRMLDLIELNTKMQYETFEMENAITEFGINADISYGGQHFTIRKETGYE